MRSSYRLNAHLYLLAAVVAWISIRPLFHSAGDFLIYFKGAEQILSGQELYRTDFAPFGRRFFNGPVWGLVLSPLTLLPAEYALIIFRFFSLVASVILIWRLAPGSQEQKILYCSLFLLWFPSRMNLNLAQGASIAAALAVYVAHRLEAQNLRKFELFATALALTIAVNFKPTLVIFFLIYLILKKEFRFFLIFIILNFGIFLTQMLMQPTATYFDWALLMSERSRRIIESDFANLVGPWALAARVTNLDPKWIGYISLLLVVLVIAFVLKNGKSAFHFRESLVVLSVGVLFGPYSPAQDSLLLSILLVISIPQLGEKFLHRIFFVAISCFWALSTEKSILKSLFLIVIISFVIYKLFDSRLLLFVHVGIAASLLALNQSVQYDHITYDIAGLGSLIGCGFVLGIYFKRGNTLSKLKNRR